jgi:Glutathione S-transferase, N-terminal domain
MLLVEEKQVPIKIELVPMRSYGDKPPAFLRKVPSGLLPAIEVNGQIITECKEEEGKTPGPYLASTILILIYTFFSFFFPCPMYIILVSSRIDSPPSLGDYGTVG